MSNLYNIGMSGLRNAQLQLSTTSNNLANQPVKGYTRQHVVTDSAPMSEGGIRVGNGVFTYGVQRDFDAGLNDQMNQSLSKESAFKSLSDGIGQLNQVFNTSDVSLDKSINKFFNSAASVAQDPSSASARQSFLSSAGSMTNQFHSMSTQLETVEKSTDAAITTHISNINEYAKRIGSLNEEITKTRAKSGAEPSDLMDLRDKAVSDLSRLAGIKVSTQNGDQYNVSLNDGTSLVMGEDAFPIDRDSASNVTGGALAGAMQFRSGILSEVRGNLDSLAHSLATESNRVSTQGFDLDGNPGQPLFNVSGEAGAAKNISMAINDPRKVAAAGEANSGQRDNRNALAFADLKNQNFSIGNTKGTFSDAFSVSVSRVGSAGNDAQARLDAQSSISTVLSQKQQEVSGVNLNDEAANMQKQQQYFQANAKIIQTANTMMDALMNLR